MQFWLKVLDAITRVWLQYYTFFKIDVLSYLKMNGSLGKSCQTKEVSEILNEVFKNNILQEYGTMTQNEEI